MAQAQAIESYDEFESLSGGGFLDIVEERQELAAQKKELDRQAAEIKVKMTELDSVVGVMLAGVDRKSILAGKWVTTVVDSKSADKLEPVLLVQLGVSLDIIQQATVPGKSYSYVKISEAK